MNWLLIHRHAIAEGYSSQGDSGRALTDEGRDQEMKVLKYLRRQYQVIDCMWMSPYVRARQTAEIITSGMDVGKTRTSEQLKPEADAHEFLQEFLVDVLALKNANLMIVGHEPNLSALTQLLLDVPHMSFSLNRSGLIELKYEWTALGGIRCELNGWLSPEHWS